jgi:hypothetical protein
MPWGVLDVSQLRLSFVHLVMVTGRPVTEACRSYGISQHSRRKREDGRVFCLAYSFALFARAKRPVACYLVG